MGRFSFGKAVQLLSGKVRKRKQRKDNYYKKAMKSNIKGGQNYFLGFLKIGTVEQGSPNIILLAKGRSRFVISA